MRLAQHVEGIVDAYHPSGAGRWHRRGAPVDLRALVAPQKAQPLLVKLADGWLRNQVVGPHTSAEVAAHLAG